MERLLAWLLTYLVAAIVALAAVVVVLPFGLVAPEAIVYPLALVEGALLAAVGAGWTVGLLTGAGGAVRLRAVASLTEALAAVVAVVILAGLAQQAGLRPRVWDVPPIYIGLVASLVLAGGATVAAWRLRGGQTRPDSLRTTAILLVVAVLAVPLTILVAGFAGLTGA